MEGVRRRGGARAPRRRARAAARVPRGADDEPGRGGSAGAGNERPRRARANLEPLDAGREARHRDRGRPERARAGTRDEGGAAGERVSTAEGNGLKPSERPRRSALRRIRVTGVAADRKHRPAERFQKGRSPIPRAHNCMLCRGAYRSLHAVLLRPRRLGPCPRPSRGPARRMSIGADATDRPADVAPPTKMPRLEDALRVKKISEHAVLPVRGSDGAAGYDLASAYDYGASPRPGRPDPTSRPASERDATERDRSGSVGRSGKIRRSLPRGRFFLDAPRLRLGPRARVRCRFFPPLTPSPARSRPLQSSPLAAKAS